MSSPHVSGVVAMALVEGNFTSVEQVSTYLGIIGTKGVIQGNLNGGPNLLLYGRVDGGTIPALES